jgi:hypothetical protein
MVRILFLECHIAPLRTLLELSKDHPGVIEAVRPVLDSASKKLDALRAKKKVRKVRGRQRAA